MKSKIIFAAVVLSSALILSGCNSRQKAGLEIENQNSMTVSTTPASASVSPTLTPTDSQMMIDLESNSDASLDTEFSALEKDIE